MAETILELIPAQIRSRVCDLSVIEAGWAAGPGWIVRKVHRYAPPVTLQKAVDWLQTYRHLYRACHVLFCDRSVLWLHPNSFAGYDRNDKRLKNATAGVRIQTGEGDVDVAIVPDDSADMH